MKTYLLIILLITALFSFGQYTDDQFDKAFFFQKPAEAHRLKSTFIESANYDKWDVTYNRLAFNIDPAIATISGSVYFEITALSDQLSSVTIDLSDSLTVQAIKNSKANLSFTHKYNKILISFAKALKLGEKESFTISYGGKPTTSGFGSFTQGTHNGFPVIYTLSEPYGAMEWWPCKQSLIDKIDSIDIVATCPSQYRTASNGLLITDSIKNSLRTCHWKHRHPISTYLVFVSTTNYSVYSDWATLKNGTKVEILNYVYPEELVHAKTVTPITADYLELYSNLFIDYPFKNEKYGHAQFGWGGGMEHQTMTSMGEFSNGLIAHELAHQWFGDYITCRSWQDIWLNEGFATFLTGLAWENLDAYWWPLWKKEIIKSVTSQPGGSVFVADTTDIWQIFSSRLSYKKGAYVLQMLRGQLGDENFFKGMKNYLTDPRVANGFATTALFRENMETAADTTLTEFFNDWIYGEGHPVYDINWHAENNEIKFLINQTPSTLNGPFFEMKIPFRLYFGNDSLTYWIPNNEPSQRVSIKLDKLPDSIKVDPDLWLLANFRSVISSVPATYSKYELYAYLSDGFLFVDVPEVQSATCSVYSLNGQRLGSSQWNQYNKTISVGNYAAGVYFCHFNSAQANFVTKFLIP